MEAVLALRILNPFSSHPYSQVDQTIGAQVKPLHLIYFVGTSILYASFRNKVEHWASVSWLVGQSSQPHY